MFVRLFWGFKIAWRILNVWVKVIYVLCIATHAVRWSKSYLKDESDQVFKLLNFFSKFNISLKDSIRGPLEQQSRAQTAMLCRPPIYNIVLAVAHTHVKCFSHGNHFLLIDSITKNCHFFLLLLRTKDV